MMFHTEHANETYRGASLRVGYKYITDKMVDGSTVTRHDTEVGFFLAGRIYLRGEISQNGPLADPDAFPYLTPEQQLALAKVIVDCVRDWEEQNVA